MIRTRIPPPVYALCAAVFMWLGNRYAPAIRWIAPPWNQFGWILIALGLALDLYSILIFIRTRTTVNPLRPGNATQLVVSGVYRISRNPMYLGMVLSLTGWAWLLGSPTCLLLVLLFDRVLVIVQIAPEEIALRDLFGTSYGDYSKQVNRWIGRKNRSTKPPAK